MTLDKVQYTATRGAGWCFRQRRRQRPRRSLHSRPRGSYRECYPSRHCVTGERL
jgi:hypothetical protein